MKSCKDTGPAALQVMPNEEESVFNQLFREHFRALSFFACSIIGQELFAKDIVQECFIKVWCRRKQLINLTGLRSYLYAAVKNDCISYLRKKAVMDRKREIYIEKVKDITLSFDKEIITREIFCELYNRIKRLPEKMQEVVRLYYLEGMSSAEIGRVLRKTTDTVQHQRKAALRLLGNGKKVLLVA